MATPLLASKPNLQLIKQAISQNKKTDMMIFHPSADPQLHLSSCGTPKTSQDDISPCRPGTDPQLQPVLVTDQVSTLQDNCLELKAELRGHLIHCFLDVLASLDMKL